MYDPNGNDDEYAVESFEKYVTDVSALASFCNVPIWVLDDDYWPCLRATRVGRSDCCQQLHKLDVGPDEITLAHEPGDVPYTVVILTPPSFIAGGDGLHKRVSAEYAGEFLHELAHALAGPRSLEDEDTSGLMGLEWALLQKLQGDEYAHARRQWERYVLGGRDCIGPTDAFLDDPRWAECVAHAQAAGFLNADGKLRTESLYPHPTWAVWDEKTQALLKAHMAVPELAGDLAPLPEGW